MSPQKKDLDRIFHDGTAIDAALQQAYREAVRLHRMHGVPMVFWENGKIVEIPADQLEDVEPHPHPAH